MPVNRISAKLTLRDEKEIPVAITTLREKMPFLIRLSPNEHHSLPKTGNVNRPFVIQARNFTNEQYEVLSREFDLGEFNRDAALFEALATIEQKLTVVSELVADTLVAAGIGGPDDMIDDTARRLTRKRKDKLPADETNITDRSA